MSIFIILLSSLCVSKAALSPPAFPDFPTHTPSSQSFLHIPRITDSLENILRYFNAPLRKNFDRFPESSQDRDHLQTSAGFLYADQGLSNRLSRQDLQPFPCELSSTHEFSKKNEKPKTNQLPKISKKRKRRNEEPQGLPKESKKHSGRQGATKDYRDFLKSHKVIIATMSTKEIQVLLKRNGIKRGYHSIRKELNKLNLQWNKRDIKRIQDQKYLAHNKENIKKLSLGEKLKTMTTKDVQAGINVMPKINQLPKISKKRKRRNAEHHGPTQKLKKLTHEESQDW